MVLFTIMKINHSIKNILLLVIAPLVGALLFENVLPKSHDQKELHQLVVTISTLTTLAHDKDERVLPDINALAKQIGELLKKSQDKEFIQEDTAEYAKYIISKNAPFLSKFLYLAALIGFGIIALEHQIKEVLKPEFIGRFRNIFTQNNNRSRSQDIDLSSVLSTQLSIIRQDLLDEIRQNTNPEDSPKVEKAMNALLDGDIDGAIKELSAMADKDPKYKPRLLTGLILSKTPKNLDRAVNLLDDVGQPIHYLRLAYEFWVKHNINKAIAVLEEGHKIVPKDNIRQRIAIENSLAYYYADANRTTKAGKALDFAKRAVSKTKELEGETDLYAGRLATLGYVLISFGDDENKIEEGIKHCENARRLGANLKLFRKHIRVADERLNEFSGI